MCGAVQASFFASDLTSASDNNLIHRREVRSVWPDLRPYGGPPVPLPAAFMRDSSTLFVQPHHLRVVARGQGMLVGSPMRLSEVFLLSGPAQPPRGAFLLTSLLPTDKIGQFIRQCTPESWKCNCSVVEGAGKDGTPFHPLI